MTKKKETHDKDYFDSPVTKIMRNNLGMNEGGTYADKDYPGRDTKKQTAMKAEMRSNPWARQYINANAKYQRHKAQLDLYRKTTQHISSNPLVQQHFRNRISRENNKLAKEKLALHNEPWQFKGEDDPNRQEVINQMTMATGKPNMDDDPVAYHKSGSNVNSDVFKNKWDGHDW